MKKKNEDRLSILLGTIFFGGMTFIWSITYHHPWDGVAGTLFLIIIGLGIAGLIDPDNIDKMLGRK